MRIPLRSRTPLLIALASLTTLASCVGGMPYRRPGSDLVTREGPSDTSWWASTIACSVMADSSKRRGSSGADDCARQRPGTGTTRDPNRQPGHQTP
jgi:hypothetical protein